MGLPNGEEVLGLPLWEGNEDQSSWWAKTMAKTLDWPSEVLNWERAQEIQFRKQSGEAVSPKWGS
ncbi:hypothetical protein GCM10008949_44740 [Deinococcus humi]|nr:hypothetical protein GCM10008949_44740 [Deinococcus humi]